MKTIRRTIYPEVKVLDEKMGLVEYVASDQTLDHYREVVMANGWRFTYFQNNAPFVDSHNYSSVDRLLGTVKSYEVKSKRLVETVQWAVDVPENQLAKLGFSMVVAGHLKAVSVGFYPTKRLTRWSSGKDYEAYQAQVSKLGYEDGQTQPDVIYTEQEQVELSAVILGANPNALARIAKAYKDGIIDDTGLDYLSDLCESERTLSGKLNSMQQTCEHEHSDARRPVFRRMFRSRLQQMIETI